jgi:DHA1 family bicyclomycin/chloramphenicol resistance-like MFS transporter
LRGSVAQLRLIVLLSMISAFLPLVTDGFLPALRPMMAELGIDVARAQLAISVSLAGFAAAQLVVGALADRFGRRPVIVAAVCLLILASVGVGTAGSLEALLAFRFMQGLAAAAGPVLARAIVRDLCSRVEGARVLSLVAFGLAIVPLGVPALNALVAEAYGWRATLVTYVVYLGATLAVILAAYQETLAARDRRALSPGQMGDTAMTIARNPAALGYTLCCVFGYGGLATWISAAPHLLHDVYGVPAARFGLYWGIPVVSYAIGSWSSAWALGRYSSGAILTAGTCSLLAGAGLLAALYGRDALTLTGLMAGVGLYNFGWSVVQPHAQVGVLALQPERAGRVSAILGFLQMLWGAAVGVAFGWWHDGSPRTAVALLGAAAIAVAAMRLVTVASRRHEEART